MKAAIDVSQQNKAHFQTLLLIAHYYTIKISCQQVSTLKHIALKLSIALLRYTDIIPADKAFYEAGN